MVVTGVGFLVLAGCYILFAGSGDPDELVAAGIAAAAGAALLVCIRAATGRRLSLAGPWQRVLAKPLLELAPDAVRVGVVLSSAVLGRRPRGVIGWQAFRHGADDPADAGRRALTVLAVSLAPNGYVLDLPGEADAMLLHRLAPQAARAGREWPL